MAFVIVQWRPLGCDPETAEKSRDLRLLYKVNSFIQVSYDFIILQDAPFEGIESLKFAMLLLQLELHARLRMQNQIGVSSLLRLWVSVIRCHPRHVHNRQCVLCTGVLILCRKYEPTIFLALFEECRHLCNFFYFHGFTERIILPAIGFWRKIKRHLR